MCALLSFRSGVHPLEEKDISASIASRRLPFPDEVILPLSQHLGAPAKPLVKAGDRVERGDLLADPAGFISAPVHATAAGIVKEVGLWPHPNGTSAPAVRIEVDRYSAQMLRPRQVPHWEDLEPAEISDAIRNAGVVGLGGAAFPSFVKLNPPKEEPVELLLVNGCECEPYLTSDHRVMLEQSERVVTGIRILLKGIGIGRAVIGIEANKPDAIEAMRKAISAAALGDIEVSVQPLTVKYPQGAEKMLIKAITGKEVPSGALPSAIGVVVQNVATVAMVAEVFETGLPLIERIVTVTGRGIKEPGNWTIPFGTKLSVVLEHCGGLTDDAEEVIFGGPMMGLAVGSLDVPILKGTGGILVLSKDECKKQEVMPCIRCGHCLDACPIFLNPQLLGSLAKAERYEDMPAAPLNDCMLCGRCSFVCPSNIPLSQLFAMSKTHLRKLSAP